MNRPVRLDDLVRQARAQLAQGHAAAAEALCRAILQAAPSRIDATALLGSALLSQRKSAAAVTVFQSGVKAHPDADDLWNGLGIALQNLAQVQEAAIAFHAAIRVAPAEPLYHFNLGNALRRSRQHGEASVAYAEASRLAPGNATYLSASLRERQQTCWWDGLEADAARLFALAESGTPVHPFRLLALGAAPSLLRRNAERWAQQTLPRDAALAEPPSGPVPRPLVVGYLSGDYREHPTPSLVADLFAAHDREIVRVHAYSLGPDDGGGQRRRIAASADRFVDLAGTPDAAAARRIRDDGVHILVDLMGWTSDAHPRIVAYRPAPLQVNWLGYPGTSGSPAHDYLIADPVVLTLGEEVHCSEQVVRLPGCYQPNSRRTLAPAPTRRDAGLPATGVVYCCFNLPWKLERNRFALWMRVLREVPGSVLWLLDGGPEATGNLRTQAAAAGVDPDRLVLAPRLPAAEHLARYRVADLFLDTLPYNAHTTASDALWAGCPVLTRRGDGFAGRVAASLLSAAGLHDLIAETDEDYEAIARRLGERPEELEALRARLAHPDTLPPFDATGFARHIEAAYAEMWRRGARPTGFDLTADGEVAVAAMTA